MHVFLHVRHFFKQLFKIIFSPRFESANSLTMSQVCNDYYLFTYSFATGEEKKNIKKKERKKKGFRPTRDEKNRNKRHCARVPRYTLLALQ